MLLAAVRHGGHSFSLPGSGRAAALPEGRRCGRPEFIGGPGTRRAACPLASRQEDTEHLGDLVAGEHQPRITALGVELGELLTQQREQQADVEGQRAARDQPGHRVGFALVGRPLAEKGVPLGLVDDYLEAEDLYVVPDMRLQLEQVLPGALVGVAVDDALHQHDDGGRQVGLGHGVLPVTRPTARVKVTAGRVAVRSHPSGPVQLTCSDLVSS